MIQWVTSSGIREKKIENKEVVYIIRTLTNNEEMCTVLSRAFEIIRLDVNPRLFSAYNVLPYTIPHTTHSTVTESPFILFMQPQSRER